MNPTVFLFVFFFFIPFTRTSPELKLWTRSTSVMIFKLAIRTVQLFIAGSSIYLLAHRLLLSYLQLYENTSLYAREVDVILTIAKYPFF